jgi:hypothetical protein
MRKVLPILTAISLVLPVLALADEPGIPTTVLTAPQIDLLIGIIQVGNLIFTIVLSLAVIFLIYAAVLFVTAAGAPEKVDQARHIILYAAIGIAVALLAKGIVLYIHNYLKP